MISVLKKIQIISLVALVGFGVGSSFGEISLKPANSKQYVLSSYSRRHNWTHLPQGQAQSAITVTKTSLPDNIQESNNWAGYVVTPTSSNAYTSVSGSWTVPNVSASKKNAVAAQWIGLGGVSSEDLLQMGTVEEIENGQPVAEVFWEKLPDVAQDVMSVPIGSTINVSISNSSDSTWSLTFTANTPDGKTETQTVSTTLDSSYAQGIGTSAEWISEDPSDANSKLVPLANMGTVKYQSAMVNGGALNAPGNNVQPVAMVSSNGNSIMISPSELGSDGKSFSTTTSTTTNSTSGRELKGIPEPIQIRIRVYFPWD
ncbi:G1 family glutamic endopeptidase [Clostridium thailandense]|uniref:G1 family glutamic endopeptidase n=1 Tax=Clostridium thailandense TaxID=2794346 RepID=UPI003988B82A